MLMAGDEMGRSQRGNNNAYAQDNALTWIDWAHIDESLLAHTAKLADVRSRFEIFSQTHFLTDDDVSWLTPHGAPMQASDWENPANGTFTMLLTTMDRQTGSPARLAVAFNRTADDVFLQLPENAAGWQVLVGDGMTLAARSVSIFMSAAS
jgi:glycogen operon protein